MKLKIIVFLLFTNNKNPQKTDKISFHCPYADRVAHVAVEVVNLHRLSVPDGFLGILQLLSNTVNGSPASCKT